MGYNTTFRGTLNFAHEVTVPQLSLLRTILGEDVREHKEWNDKHGISYIDLVLNDDFSGIKWDDDTEKTYTMVEAVNLVTRLMREQFPDFQLSGSFLAQGEDSDDRWMLVIDDTGHASKQELKLSGQKVECPSCRHTFRVETVAA